jgi:pimeloyl-ACP methyl ester carboxylesterase
MGKRVNFFSDGLKIAGVLFKPNPITPTACPAIVMCQGAVGLKELFGFPDIAQRFADLGYMTLIFDYRGFGESEGERGRVFPQEHLDDIRNAITFLSLQSNVDKDRIALFGTSMGGAYVVGAGALDARAGWVISVVGYGDGSVMVRGRRSEEEWNDFLSAIDEDRETRTISGRYSFVDERFAAAPLPENLEARSRVIRAGSLDTKVPRQTYETIEHSIGFRPIDSVHRISPRPILFISAENDSLTPAIGIEAMHAKALEPKQYEVLSGIGHYEIYEEPHLSRIIKLTDDWISC